MSGTSSVGTKICPAAGEASDRTASNQREQAAADRRVCCSSGMVGSHNVLRFGRGPRPGRGSPPIGLSPPCDRVFRGVPRSIRLPGLEARTPGGPVEAPHRGRPEPSSQMIREPLEGKLGKSSNPTHRTRYPNTPHSENCRCSSPPVPGRPFSDRCLPLECSTGHLSGLFWIRVRRGDRRAARPGTSWPPDPSTSS